MSKLLNCGLSLAEVIGMSTSRPALVVRRPDSAISAWAARGHLGAARSAVRYVFADVVGTTRQGSTLLHPVACYLGGAEMEVSTRPFETPYIIGHLDHHHHHHH